MSTAYYLRSRGKVLGPFPLERLQTMKSRGQIGRTHQVSTDRQTWVAAGSLPELFAGPPAANDFEPFEQEAANPAAAPATASYEPSGGPSTPTAAWFYHVRGQQFGPASASELRELLSGGELGPGDMVWREGMESWAAIQDVPELRPRTAIASGAGAFDGVPSTSGLAVASLVLGIISLVIPCVGIVTGLLATIFGGISLGQISRSRGRLAGRGMAITGLVTGIIAITLYGAYVILIVLGTIAAPAANNFNL